MGYYCIVMKDITLGTLKTYFTIVFELRFLTT